MQYLSNAGLYLIDTFFTIALMAFLLRFWMQWVRADFRNPIGHFVITVTNPVVIPLRRVIPSIGTMDTATVLLAFIVAAIKTIAILAVIGRAASPLFIAVYSLAEIIEVSIYIFMGALIIQIIASWINPYSAHPLLSVAHSIAAPLCNPARKILPPIAGIDFSPILVFLFLNLSLQLLVAPLQAFPM